MLEVSHVTKKYGRTAACRDVSFHLDPGTVTVLLGPNGAGKSTIMKSIIGFLRYSGTIWVNGLDNRSLEARRILGYVPELPFLYPNLTVSEHMEFLARAYRLQNYSERSEKLLKRFELTGQKRKFGDELSKGMQQKLSLCLGPLPDPQVILLDEPMIGLDPKAIRELKAMIGEMRASGKTLLVSTHIIDTVDMLWDRTVIMQGGTVRANISRGELEDAGRSLEELFFEVTEQEASDAGDFPKVRSSAGGRGRKKGRRRADDSSCTESTDCAESRNCNDSRRCADESSCTESSNCADGRVRR